MSMHYSALQNYAIQQYTKKFIGKIIRRSDDSTKGFYAEQNYDSKYYATFSELR